MLYSIGQGFSNVRFSGGHEQRPSFGIFAEAFASIAKSKCHDIRYSPVKLKPVVFIITS